MGYRAQLEISSNDSAEEDADKLVSKEVEDPKENEKIYKKLKVKNNKLKDKLQMEVDIRKFFEDADIELEQREHEVNRERLKAGKKIDPETEKRILEEAKWERDEIDLTGINKRITKYDIQNLKIEKKKLEKALLQTRSGKIKNYLNVKRVGIQPYERKFMRECTRTFELDLLMLLDEAIYQITK